MSETEDDQPTISYRPAAGLKADFEKLFAAFTETQSVRYTEFVNVWKALQMSVIFAGRQEDIECREFTEEALALAVEHWMPPFTLQVRVGALYLLYGLYVKQPVSPPVKIRVTVNQWKNVQEFCDEIHRQQHLDVEYIFQTLCHKKAFHFVASEKPQNPLEKLGKTQETDRQETSMIEALGQRKSVLSEVLESDYLNDLQTLHEQYSQLKCTMSGPGAKEPPPSVNIIQNTLINYIKKAVATHEDWRKKKAGVKTRRRRESGTSTSESEHDTSDVDATWSPRKEQSTIGQRRAEIRARAFGEVGSASRSRRHRQATKDDVKKRRKGKSSGIDSEDTDTSVTITSSTSGKRKKKSATSSSPGTPYADTSLTSPIQIKTGDTSDDASEGPTTKKKKVPTATLR